MKCDPSAAAPSSVGVSIAEGQSRKIDGQATDARPGKRPRVNMQAAKRTGLVKSSKTRARCWHSGYTADEYSDANHRESQRVTHDGEEGMPIPTATMSDPLVPQDERTAICRTREHDASTPHTSAAHTCPSRGTCYHGNPRKGQRIQRKTGRYERDARQQRPNYSMSCAARRDGDAKLTLHAEATGPACRRLCKRAHYWLKRRPTAAVPASPLKCTTQTGGAPKRTNARHRILQRFTLRRGAPEAKPRRDPRPARQDAPDARLCGRGWHDRWPPPVRAKSHPVQTSLRDAFARCRAAADCPSPSPKGKVARLAPRS